MAHVAPIAAPLVTADTFFTLPSSDSASVNSTTSTVDPALQAVTDATATVSIPAFEPVITPSSISPTPPIMHSPPLTHLLILKPPSGLTSRWLLEAMQCPRLPPTDPTTSSAVVAQHNAAPITTPTVPAITAPPVRAPESIQNDVMPSVRSAQPPLPATTSLSLAGHITRNEGPEIQPSLEAAGLDLGSVHLETSGEDRALRKRWNDSSGLDEGAEVVKRTKTQKAKPTKVGTKRSKRAPKSMKTKAAENKEN
ncbi:hypothetical protein EW146_g9627 [Bondarzewia mesenterica]|uniref:Uncharacterized protein n=1 Tax=Bondarzewia mesenterica TaxID=1095465 RepID=A0A4V3XCM2_9AGAM|nr:hypothetical protein EW146_g9627 [Bondarzewia mesenterica]